MKKSLSLREIIAYGILFGVFVFAMIFLITIEEQQSNPNYYHEYQTGLNDPDNVRIGVLANQGVLDAEERWEELSVYLGTEIPEHTFEIVPLLYDDISTAVMNETVDFVIVNPSMYVDLNVNYGVSRIATINELSGDFETTSYGSVIFAKADDGINMYDDLKGKSFGAVDELSFGGWQMTLKELYDNGINPNTSFSEVSFLDTHKEVVLKVLDGTLDAGTVRTGVIEGMVSDGLIELSDIKVLHDSILDFPLLVSTQLYPEWPIAKTPHITDELGHEVAEALLMLEKTDQASIDASIAGFTIPQNYQDVHTTLKIINAAPYEDFGEVSFHNSIFHNRIFLIIILIALFIIVSFMFWLVHARDAMLKLTKVSQDMEKVANEANEAKGEFLANMSHEIRTPMSAIIGLSELLGGTDLTSRQKDYNHKLKSSAVNLLGIIENILDYSKIDAKKMKMENIEFELNDVLYNLSNVVTLKATEKNIEFLFDIEYGLPRKFIGDPLRLGQVLVNIVTNAIKFTEEGQVVLKIKAQDEKVLFMIEDSGIGMSQDQIDKIIQPFTQADSSFTRKYGGTGLGLTITNQLIELMGGKLSISSEEDNGSVFSFTLPLEPTDAHLKTEVPKDMNDLKVLIVDDNPISLEIINQICMSLKFDTFTVSKPEDVVKVLEKGDYSPDLIVLDYLMPKVNGIELIKTLKKKKLLKRSHSILMVSAFGKESVVKEALDIGVSEFLDKPINPSFFYNTVLGIFNRDDAPPKKRLMDGDKVDLVKPGTKIILAEDNKINQTIVGEILSKEGFDVTIANDGVEVLDILEADDFEYQLILMDIQMPRLNGRDATKIIREREGKYQNIPIVAMTAHALEVEKQKCLEAGMNDFLTKPLEVKKLFAALSKYIDIVTVSVKPQDASTFNLDFLDTKSGLQNLGNDEGFYLEILYTFYTDYKEYYNTLENLFKVGDTEDLVIEVHTIKGLAATIGATGLFDSAKELEFQFREGVSNYETLTQFLAHLKALVRNLDLYFNDNPYKKTKSI